MHGNAPSLQLNGFIADYQRGSTNYGDVRSISFELQDGRDVLTVVNGSFSTTAPSSCSPVWRIYN